MLASRLYSMQPSLVRMAGTATACLFNKFGSPDLVLKTQKVPIRELTGSDVQIKMIASPVTDLDIHSVRGKFAAKMEFPAIAGNEGVGVITAVGSNVSDMKKDDVVVFVKPNRGTWCEQCVVSAESVIPLPNGMRPELASSLVMSAGIAHRLLNGFVELKPGDVVMQNDASSAVGKAVIQMCKMRGVKTINIASDVGEWSNMFRNLETIGGDLIVRESFVHTVDFPKTISDLPTPKLVIDGRGGDALTNMCRHVSNTCVVSYNDSLDDVTCIPMSALCQKQLVFKGLNYLDWLEKAPRDTIRQMMNELFALVATDDLRCFLKKDNWSQVQAIAKEVMAYSENPERVPLMMMDQ